MRAFFKDLFGDGVSLTLVTEEEVRGLALIIDTMAYRDVTPYTTFGPYNDLEARFITFSIVPKTLPMAFVDRYGNYYVSDVDNLSSKTLVRYLLDRYRGVSIEHFE